MILLPTDRRGGGRRRCSASGKERRENERHVAKREKGTKMEDGRGRRCPLPIRIFVPDGFKDKVDGFQKLAGRESI